MAAMLELRELKTQDLQGLRRLLLLTSDAHGLYRQFGFVPVGVRKNYYAEVNEDALVMWSYEVDQPEYAALLDSIERSIPGETILDASVAERKRR